MASSTFSPGAFMPSSLVTNMRMTAPCFRFDKCLVETRATGNTGLGKEGKSRGARHARAGAPGQALHHEYFWQDEALRLSGAE